MTSAGRGDGDVGIKQILAFERPAVLDLSLLAVLVAGSVTPV